MATNTTLIIAELLSSIGFGTLFDGDSGSIFYDFDFMPLIIPRVVVIQNGSSEPPNRVFGDFRNLKVSILYSDSDPQSAKDKLVNMRDLVSCRSFVKDGVELYITILSEPLIFKVSDSEFKGALNINVVQNVYNGGN